MFICKCHFYNSQLKSDDIFSKQFWGVASSIIKHCTTAVQLYSRSLETIRGTSDYFPHYRTIWLIKLEFKLLLYKQIEPSINSDCAASISSSRSTHKGGIPSMCWTVPPRSPILPSSSNIHSLSLSQSSLLPVLRLAGTQRWMCGATVWEDFIVSLHDSYKKLAWNYFCFVHFLLVGWLVSWLVSWSVTYLIFTVAV